MKTLLSILAVTLLLSAPALQAGENCQKACDKAKAASCEKAKAASCEKAKASECSKAQGCPKEAALRKALLTHKGASLAQR